MVLAIEWMTNAFPLASATAAARGNGDRPQYFGFGGGVVTILESTENFL